MSNDPSYGPELERALELYREAQSPGPAVQQRVWSAVDASVSPPVVTDSQGPAAPAGAGLLGKLALLAGAVALGAALWWGVAPKPVGTRRAVPAPTATPTLAGQGDVVTTPALDPRGAPRDAVQPSPPLAEPEPFAAAALPVVATDNTAARAESKLQPERVRAVRSTLAVELRLMTAAQTALDAGDARRALRLLERHRRRFPAGALTEEREAARVEALCGVGRGPAAREAARRFAVRFAGSPRVARVLDRCVEKAP